MSEDLEHVERPDQPPVSGRRLSRRTMIAGTAGAAAAMWSAPAVTSLAPRAFAQGGSQAPSVCPGAAPNLICPAFPECVTAPNTPCFCIQDASGSPVCVMPPFVPTPLPGGGCTTNLDCTSTLGPNFFCIPFQAPLQSCFGSPPISMCWQACALGNA